MSATAVAPVAAAAAAADTDTSSAKSVAKKKKSAPASTTAPATVSTTATAAALTKTKTTTFLPKITFYDEQTFTVANINLSHANAIRRVILADIPTVVFDKIDMIKNTTRLNNELIQQRLRCIPIHVKETDIDDFLAGKYRVEINKKYDPDHIVYVTTGDFVYAKAEDRREADQDMPDEDMPEAADDMPEAADDMPEAVTAAAAAAAATAAKKPFLTIKELFPPFQEKHYIDIARLRPPVTADGSGDVLHFTAGFKKATAKEDNSYNVASTCSYGFTVDDDKRKKAWKQEEEKLKKAQMVPEAELAFKKKDWEFLDGKRFFQTDPTTDEPNSFDFVIESVGPFENKSIVKQAIAILMQELEHFSVLLANTKIVIEEPNTTMEQCYDVQLNVVTDDNDTKWVAGYTIGKVLEAELHKKFIAIDNKELTFCAFRKPHPHIDDCYIRIAGQTTARVAEMLAEAAQEGLKVFKILYDSIV